MITVLVYYERISLYHTMIPFFLKNRENIKKTGKKLFHFTQSVQWCLSKDKNTILFMERNFQYRQPQDLKEDELELLKQLRNKYKTIVFFCGQPEAGNNRMDILPYVDTLFYKSIFTDRANYCKKLYGKNLFADYYHQNYGINDDPPYINKNEITQEDANKPLLSWNIGIGTYPRWHWRQRMGTFLARSGFHEIGKLIGGRRLKYFLNPNFLIKTPKDFSSANRSIPVHARIKPVTCPSIAHQRRHFLDCISRFSQKDKDIFVTGRVPQNEYYKELFNSKIVLSPFGWGEVCFRDFETILTGGLLFKPDMSHLETFPNVYIPYETYIPLKWDGSDLLEQAQKYIQDDKERMRITKNAYEQYKNELAKLPERFNTLLGEYFL